MSFAINVGADIDYYPWYNLVIPSHIDATVVSYPSTVTPQPSPGGTWVPAGGYGGLLLKGFRG